jgi:hypothetical protein
MPQRTAMPPLPHSRDGTVYLVLDDFGELGRAYRETDAAQADLKTVVADLLSSPISYPVDIDIPCAWWPSTPPRAGRATSAQTSRARFCALELDHELPAAVRDFVERVCA